LPASNADQKLIFNLESKTGFVMYSFPVPTLEQH